MPQVSGQPKQGNTSDTRENMELDGFQGRIDGSRSLGRGLWGGKGRLNREELGDGAATAMEVPLRARISVQLQEQQLADGL